MAVQVCRDVRTINKAEGVKTHAKLVSLYASRVFNCRTGFLLHPHLEDRTNVGGAAMSRTETLPTMPPLLSAATMPPAEPGHSHPAPVLIMVPHVVSSVPRRTNLDGFRTSSPRPRTSYRPRRRLRRQFRVAVYAVAGLLPLLLAWSQCTDAYSIRHTAIPLLSIPAQALNGESIQERKRPRGVAFGIRSDCIPDLGLALDRAHWSGRRFRQGNPGPISGLSAARRPPRGAGP